MSTMNELMKELYKELDDDAENNKSNKGGKRKMLRRETFWIHDGNVDEQINNVIKFANTEGNFGGKKCKVNVKGVIQMQDALVVLYYEEEVD